MVTYAFGSRQFEALARPVQVLIDIAVVLLACWLGFETREYFAWLPTAAVTVVCFYCCGMYRPLKSWVGMEQAKAIARSTAISFLAMFLLLTALEVTRSVAENAIHAPLVTLGYMLDVLGLAPDALPGPSLVIAFACVFALTAVSRFLWFRAIQRPRHRGVG